MRPTLFRSGLVCAVLAAFVLLGAGTPEPASLDAMVEFDRTSFKVERTDRATEQRRVRVVVMGAGGRDAGRLVVPYNRFRNVKRIEARLLDASGEVVRKLDKDEINDFAATGAGNLYDDYRFKVVDLFYDQYPYTVEYQYEVEHKGFVYWPEWTPQSSQYPVMQASLELSVPDDIEVRFRNRLLDLEPELFEARGVQRYTWKAGPLPAWTTEPFGPAWRDQMPAVVTSTGVFKMDGYEGDMSTWNGVARWYGLINEGRQVLPDEEAAKARSLVAGVTTDREKARILYEHLQRTTRYVSIQLGIGGYQSFPAGYVCERRYGDCKALTTYMQGLLEAVGIKSNHALIRAGRNAPDVSPEFSSLLQFNHVILAVPMSEAANGGAPADTLWLECTSQTAPFGYLGSFTEDRHALLITKRGGQLVRTPATAPEDNRQDRVATVRLTKTGDATAEIVTRYSGNQHGRIRSQFAQASALERDQAIREMIQIPSFSLQETDFSGIDERHETLELPLSLDLPRYASRSGKRLFIAPNLMERWTNVPDRLDGPRQHPVRTGPYPYVDTDTVYFHVPAGFRPESMPAPVHLETDFGTFDTETTLLDDGRLRFTRRLRMARTDAPAESYEAFRSFVRGIVRSDKSRVVLIEAT